MFATPFRFVAVLQTARRLTWLTWGLGPRLSYNAPLALLSTLRGRPYYKRACPWRYRCVNFSEMDPDKQRKLKEVFREHYAVPLAGFGMAAVLIGLFLLLMTTLSHIVYVGGMK